MFTLAEKLGKSIEEIGEMSVTEFNGWMAYWNLRYGNDS